MPVMREIMRRRFGLLDQSDFRVHAHHGKGKLPKNALARPDPKHRGLLDQLPAKLRGYGKSLEADAAVLVVIDADSTPEADLLSELEQMLSVLPNRPATVMFRIAVEETESWFLADVLALEQAFRGKITTTIIKKIGPDAVVGAWEQLAKALKLDPRYVGPSAKSEWATKIVPHLNLDQPRSPSLAKLISGIDSLLNP